MIYTNIFNKNKYAANKTAYDIACSFHNPNKLFTYNIDI